MAHLGVQQIVSNGHIKKFQLCGICVVDILVKELWISLCELVPVCFEVVPDDGVAIVYKRRLFDNFHGHACHVHAKEVGLLLFGTILVYVKSSKEVTLYTSVGMFTLLSCFFDIFCFAFFRFYRSVFLLFL